MTTVSPALRKLGVLYAIYLCFASLRIQEIITPLAIPKLPMILSLGLATWLIIGVPGDAWLKLWHACIAIRLQSFITMLAVLTVPLGIWAGNSLDLLYPGYFVSVIVFIAGIVLLRDREVLRRVLQIMVITLAGIAVLVFFGIGAGAVGDEGRLTVGASFDPNDYAWVLVTFIPVALWLGVRRKSTAVFWFGAATLLLLSIVPTQSRGGFVALLASTIVLVLYGSSGWRRILILLGIGVLGAAFFSYIDAIGADRLTDFSAYEGGTGRTEFWKQGLKWMIQRPWGYGMGNYATYNVWMTRDYHGAHSAYINLGVDLGILGGCAFIALWLHVLGGVKHARSAAMTLPGNAAAASEASMCGFLLASMAGNAAGSLFLNTQYSALTLFTQAVGAAVILGSPFRTTAYEGPHPASTSSGRAIPPRRDVSATRGVASGRPVATDPLPPTSRRGAGDRSGWRSGRRLL